MRSTKYFIEFLTGVLAALLLSTLLSMIDRRYEHSLLFFLMAFWAGAIILYLCLPPFRRKTERKRLADCTTKDLIWQAKYDEVQRCYQEAMILFDDAILAGYKAGIKMRDFAIQHAKYVESKKLQGNGDLSRNTGTDYNPG